MATGTAIVLVRRAPIEAAIEWDPSLVWIRLHQPPADWPLAVRGPRRHTRRTSRLVRVANARPRVRVPTRRAIFVFVAAMLVALVLVGSMDFSDGGEGDRYGSSGAWSQRFRDGEEAP
jgi:hypothetical protein